MALRRETGAISLPRTLFWALLALTGFSLVQSLQKPQAGAASLEFKDAKSTVRQRSAHKVTEAEAAAMASAEPDAEAAAQAASQAHARTTIEGKAGTGGNAKVMAEADAEAGAEAEAEAEAKAEAEAEAEAETEAEAKAGNIQFLPSLSLQETEGPGQPEEDELEQPSLGDVREDIAHADLGQEHQLHDKGPGGAESEASAEKGEGEGGLDPLSAWEKEADEDASRYDEGEAVAEDWELGREGWGGQEQGPGEESNSENAGDAIGGGEVGLNSASAAKWVSMYSSFLKTQARGQQRSHQRVRVVKRWVQDPPRMRTITVKRRVKWGKRQWRKSE